MRRFVQPDEDEPDLDELELGSFDVLPHGGRWSRAVGEDVMRCQEHGLRPGDR